MGFSTPHDILIDMWQYIFEADVNACRSILFNPPIPLCAVLLGFLLFGSSKFQTFRRWLSVPRRADTVWQQLALVESKWSPRGKDARMPSLYMSRIGCAGHASWDTLDTSNTSVQYAKLRNGWIPIQQW